MLYCKKNELLRLDLSMRQRDKSSFVCFGMKKQLIEHMSISLDMPNTAWDNVI